MWYRCAGITGWTSILRTLLVQQEHWHSLKLFDWVDLAISADSADDEAESADDDGDLDADAEWAVGSADSADDEAESNDDAELDIGSEWTINNAGSADDEAESADDEANLADDGDEEEEEEETPMSSSGMVLAGSGAAAEATWVELEVMIKGGLVDWHVACIP